MSVAGAPQAEDWRWVLRVPGSGPFPPGARWSLGQGRGPAGLGGGREGYPGQRRLWHGGLEAMLSKGPGRVIAPSFLYQ